MRVQVKAIVPVNYTSKKTGEKVIGSELHILRNLNENEKSKGTRGTQISDSIFTRLDCSNVQPDKQYDFLYECSGGKYAELVEIKAVP